ncbi:hypothetical protein ANCCAN_18580 [Ancylostoma caninum]|uniref:Uncharacterized protein n=1 Tax=Ancylostoma caninum TaxID=29170 RepID=A0A368FVQ8_ANCCA|nr:hypothetical protein ANCCAN_18580 [Ancylostoma caninum]
MSHLRNNQQQRERIVNNLGGEPRQNGGAFERARNPINPPMPPGNVVVDPVFVNPVPPLGNNVILNANPPLEDNIILHADPPMRNNRGPPVNVAPGPQRRRGRRGGNNQILQEVPLVQFPAIIPQAMFPPPPPPPAFVQPIIPIQVPSVLLQPPPVPVQAAYFPPFVPQAVVPVVQQPPPFRQQPFLNLDPDLLTNKKEHACSMGKERRNNVQAEAVKSIEIKLRDLCVRHPLGTVTCVVVVTMSHLRNNQQQRERIVNNFGGEPRQNGGAFERARNPINPPMPPGNVVVDPVFVNPVPPLGNNVIFNANPPLEENIILHADPPMRNNRGPPVNVAPGPQVS